MDRDKIEKIKSNPKFVELVKKRNRLALILTFIMLGIYYGFILLLAFAPNILAIKIGTATTLGIPIGIGVIISAFILTGIYTKIANSEFDELTKAIKEEVKA